MALPLRPRRHQNTMPGPLISIEEATAVRLPQTEEEWAVEDRKKKIDINDLAHELGPAGVARWLDESPTHVIKWPDYDDGFISAQTVLRSYPTMRPPVIHGLLRETETCNIVAAPKMNKSFLVGNISLNIIGGGMLLGKFQCERGRVGLIDNELHCETMAERLRVLAPALNVPLDRVGRLIDLMPLRGQLVDINQLEQRIEKIRYKTYKVIILDALYKFYPGDGFDESDNAAMARLYTQLDAYAEYTGAAFILIHHASKGDQSGKETTDIGAGAGAQSRACDAHMVLRRHEETGIYVIDCANRSFPPIQRFCARFKFPVWEAADDKDPEAMAGLQKKRPVGRPKKSESSPDAPETAAAGQSEQPPNAAPSGVKAEKDQRSPEERLAARLRDFFAVVLQPSTAAQMLESGKYLKFPSWTVDHLTKKLLPDMVAQGVLFCITGTPGELTTTYAARQAETVTDTATDVPSDEEAYGPDLYASEEPDEPFWNSGDQ